MELSSLKIIKSHNNAIKMVTVYPLISIVVLFGFMIFNQYQLYQYFAWSWLSSYLLPIAAIIIFDIVLLLSVRRKSNLNNVLSQFTPEELAQIDAQFPDKLSLFKQPIVYTDKVVFAAKGLNIQAIPVQDLVWLKFTTSTGYIELVTRQKKTSRITFQFMPMFFKELVEKVRSQRPNILSSDNVTDGEGKELTELYSRDFQALVRRSDGQS